MQQQVVEFGYYEIFLKDVTLRLYCSNCWKIKRANTMLLNNLENLCNEMVEKIKLAYKQSYHYDVANYDTAILYTLVENYKMAKIYYLASINFTPSVINLAEKYAANGQVNKAIKYYKLVAKRDINCSKKVHYDIANLYLKFNYAKALKYFKLGAKQGHSMSAYKVARMIEILECDDNSLVKLYYKLAISLQNGKAACRLGNYFSNIYRLSKTVSYYQKAIKYYKKAIELRYNGACIKLATLYAKNEDIQCLPYYVDVIAYNNDKEALQFLANYYKDSSKSRAIEYYDKLVALGDSESALILARIYYDDNNVDKSIEYYKIADSFGNAHAAMCLGCYYGVDLDNMCDWVLWYERACFLGSGLASFSLGVHYEDNCDYDKAKKYYQIAANLKYYKAYKYLANMYDELCEYHAALKCFIKYAKVIGNRKKVKKIKLEYEYETVFYETINQNLSEEDYFIVYKFIEDDEIKTKFMQKLLATYPEYADIFIIDINKIKSYDILKDHWEQLSDKNKQTLAYIDNLQLSSEKECNVCGDEGLICRLPCHAQHTICKNCVIKVKICPYCRKPLKN
jgi:TPR repeat protein